jgi:diguanylate cyclase (GGDEF)-like protein
MPLLQVFFTKVPIVALCSYLVLMIFFWISTKDKFIRAFMWMLGALIIWTSSAVFMTIDLYPGALFWDRVMVVGMILVPFFLYIFVSIFTNSFEMIKTAVWGIFTIIAIVINLLGYVVPNIETITSTVTLNGRVYTVAEFKYYLGLGAIPVYFLLFVLISVILYKAYSSMRHGNTTYERIAPVMAGIIILFLGSLANVLPSLGKYPVDVLACFINAILIFVAIYKYRLMELRFMVTKGLIYSIMVASITALYVLSVLFVEEHFGTLYGDILPYYTIILALMVAVVFQPLFRLAGNLVGIIFYKAEYAQRQALKNFSLSISNKLDLNNIARDLVEAVQLALHAKQIMVLMKNENKQHYYVFQTSSQVYKPDLYISFDNPIIKWMSHNKTCLSREELYSLPYFKSMWEKEKRELYELDIELIIPMRSDNDIIGLLMLTGKKNNIAYTMDDIDLLNYLGASTAVAFENARLYALSQAEAITDNLTRLYNHRYFYKALAEQKEKIGSAELSLLVLDLDSFKLYNDLYGHVEGDRALQKVADTMTGIVGDKGIICRYGGEEFTVLLPYHDPKMAFDIAEKIRLEIQKKFFNSDDLIQRFLTVSIGVCTYPHAAPNTEELLKRADLAMYTAKRQGKNQTVVYTPRTQGSDNLENSDNYQHNIDFPNYTTTIYALTAAIDTKDHYTFGHSQRVAEYSIALAVNMSLDDSYIEILREAALLHDIGKIGIPENILTKEGRLTAEEYEIIQKHAELSLTIIKHLPSLNYVAPAVIAHHERWDGTGYPRRLKGENIPLAARILAIADAFDAMTSDRPYRAGLSISAALKEITNNIGTQFDPTIAKLFIRLVLEGKIKVNQRSDPHSVYRVHRTAVQ